MAVSKLWIDRQPEINRLLKEGKSWQEIANHFNVSRQRLDQVKCELNLDTTELDQKKALREQRIKELVAFTGCSESRIRVRLRMYESGSISLDQLESSKRADPLVYQQILPKAIAEFENGATLKDLGEKYQVNADYLGEKMRALGIDTNKNHYKHIGGGKYMSDKIDEYLKLFEQGMTIKEIAAQYNLTASTLSKKLRERGIDTLKYLRRRGRRYSEIR